MSKETELSDEQIDNCVGNLGMAENSILVGPEEIRKAMRAVIAADRELRRGDAQMPVVAWLKYDGQDFEYNTVDEFSGGRTGGSALVKLSDAHAALTAQAVNAKRLTQAARDITTVLRVEGMDLEIGSRKLLKEARDAIDAAIAKEKAK